MLGWGSQGREGREGVHGGPGPGFGQNHRRNTMDSTLGSVQRSSIQQPRPGLPPLVPRVPASQHVPKLLQPASVTPASFLLPPHLQTKLLRACHASLQCKTVHGRSILVPEIKSVGQCRWCIHDPGRGLSVGLSTLYRVCMQCESFACGDHAVTYYGLAWKCFDCDSVMDTSSVPP
jgi:hypothetical protein